MVEHGRVVRHDHVQHLQSEFSLAKISIEKTFKTIEDYEMKTQKTIKQIESSNKSCLCFFGLICIFILLKFRRRQKKP